MRKQKQFRKKKCGDILKWALDTLALALVDHNHQWTKSERRLYERAIKACMILALFLCSVW